MPNAININSPLEYFWTWAVRAREKNGEYIFFVHSVVVILNDIRRCGNNGRSGNWHSSVSVAVVVEFFRLFFSLFSVASSTIAPMRLVSTNRNQLWCFQLADAIQPEWIRQPIQFSLAVHFRCNALGSFKFIRIMFLPNAMARENNCVRTWIGTVLPPFGPSVRIRTVNYMDEMI